MERAWQAPGIRFHPTDVELVMYYLKRKVLGRSLRFDAISVIDVYKYDPNDLPGLCSMQNKDLKWYFFCPRERKYASGARMNRATESGYWKTTGKDRPVHYNNNVVGMIKTLIFHRGKAPKGVRTDWVMHEYRLEEKAETGVVQDSCVLCSIFQKDGPGPRNGAQYGAPFREEDWTDGEEDDCIVERRPATIPGPNMLPSRAPERVRDGSSIESCVSDVVPSSSKELQLATRNNVILPAMMPGPNNMLPRGVSVAGSSRAPECVHIGSSIESCLSDVVPSSSKELQLATRNNVIHLNSVPSSSRGSPLDSCVSNVVAREPCCEVPQPIPNIVHAEKLQSSMLNQCFEDGSFTVNGSNTNEGTDYVDPHGNEIADGVDLSDGIDFFNDLGDLSTMDFLNNREFPNGRKSYTIEEILAAEDQSYLELMDLDEPLNPPNEDECFHPDPAAQDPSAQDPTNPFY
ncbi:hypothetical protein UlMin_037781 [Ulmus minor]